MKLNNRKKGVGLAKAIKFSKADVKVIKTLVDKYL